MINHITRTVPTIGTAERDIIGSPDVMSTGIITGSGYMGITGRARITIIRAITAIIKVAGRHAFEWTRQSRLMAKPTFDIYSLSGS